MKGVFQFVFLFGTLSSFIAAKQINFFRKDYTYNETFDAFYKMHWNYPVFSWDDAFLACDDEGATLFYPNDKEELHLIRALAVNVARRHSDNNTEIFLGLHDKYGLGEFITVDGHSTDSLLSVTEPETSNRFPSGYCVLMDVIRGSYRVGPCVRNNLQERLSFVCKKEKAVNCPTIDEDYQHAKSLRKCYKINRRQKTWDEAYRTCYMEGGILTIIQDSNEARWLHDFLENNEHTYHVGIRRITPRGEIYTVKADHVIKALRAPYLETVPVNIYDVIYFPRILPQGSILSVHNGTNFFPVRALNSARSGYQNIPSKKFDTVYQRMYNNEQEYEQDCGAIRSTNSEIYTTTTDCGNKLPFICEIEVNKI